MVGGAHEQSMVVEGPGVVEDRLAAAVHQVHVPVDQAGEDGRLRVLQDGRAGREGHLRRRPGGDDAVVLHQDGPVRDGVAPGNRPGPR